MSHKIQECSVSIESVDKKIIMEHPKKKAAKQRSRQTTPVPQELAAAPIPAPVQPPPVQPPPDNTDNESTSSKASESSHSSNAAKIANGRGKAKKEKAGNNGKNNKENGTTADVALNANGTTSNGAGGHHHEEHHEEPASLVEESSSSLVAEQDNDELFPELIYDETSDNECNFDSSPDLNNSSSGGRSMTRRSQAKVIPTPETPQMLNAKTDALVETSSSPVVDQGNGDAPQKEKLLKMKEIYCLTPTRGSPVSDKIVKDADAGKNSGDEMKNGSTTEVSHSKIDTNYSKSRIKVSPYRRSARISDQYSTIANYSGNNSTQDTDLVGDISSSSRGHSPVVDASDDSTMNGSEDGEQSNSENGYSANFRSIKGRKSYRPLREYSLKNLFVQRQKAMKAEAEKNEDSMSVTVSSANATIGSEIRDTMLSEPSPKWTPVGHVVGRKRKQSSSDKDSGLSSGVESPALAQSESEKDTSVERPSKRQRLFGYVSTPFRNLREKISSSTPMLGRYYQVQKEATASAAEEAQPSVAGSESEQPALLVAEPVPEHKFCSIM